MSAAAILLQCHLLGRPFLSQWLIFQRNPTIPLSFFKGLSICAARSGFWSLWDPLIAAFFRPLHAMTKTHCWRFFASIHVDLASLQLGPTLPASPLVHFLTPNVYLGFRSKVGPISWSSSRLPVTSGTNFFWFFCFICYFCCHNPSSFYYWCRPCHWIPSSLLANHSDTDRTLLLLFFCCSWFITPLHRLLFFGLDLLDLVLAVSGTYSSGFAPCPYFTGLRLLILSEFFLG